MLILDNGNSNLSLQLLTRSRNGKVIIEEKHHQIFKSGPGMGLIKYRLLCSAVMLHFDSSHNPRAHSLLSCRKACKSSPPRPLNCTCPEVYWTISIDLCIAPMINIYSILFLNVSHNLAFISVYLLIKKLWGFKHLFQWVWLIESLICN